MIYLVCLVEADGDLTPLLAFRVEETAQRVADRMGDMGTVIAVSLVDEVE